MAGFVVDASVVVEYLLRTSLGRQLAGLLEGEAIHAPQHLDAEVLAVLRRAVHRRLLTEERAQQALGDLAVLPLARLPLARLLRDAWALRHNVSAYDALYVAAARVRGLPLLTADGPLARAPGLGIVVQNVRIS